MTVYKNMSRWTDDQLLDECRRKLGKKLDADELAQLLREAMQRIGKHRQPRRAPGRPPAQRSDFGLLVKNMGVLVEQVKRLEKNTTIVQAQVASLSSNNRK